MNRWLWSAALAVAFFFACPFPSPAPLIYRPGEGWTYESPGSEGGWARTRAKDQLEVAQEAFDAGNYNLAIKAARRTVRTWPLSDYAPQAQYLLARCHQAKGNDEKAFKEYQALLERYPKFDDYQEVIGRQFEITNAYLNGRWFRLWGYIPLFRSMERTVRMYEQLIKNGPYSPVAPQAQINIGTAREKQSSFFNKTDPFREAVTAYQTAADRYFDNTEIASEAIYKEGRAHFKQARKADYDQSVAGSAITTFGDFVTLFPNDPRVSEARQMIQQLRAEQARGSFVTARFYEKRKRWNGALIYYNEVVLNDPTSPYADPARQKIEEIRDHQTQQTAQR
jgi:outer membrane protein assembly factor BamD (BamD/ComL family)